MNTQENLDILDFLTIISFIVSLQSLELANKNLVENRQQTKDTQSILKELQDHLHEQDEILANQDEILLKLNGKER